MTWRGSKISLFAVLIVAIGVGVAGCRENEEGRTVALEKGKYPGEIPSSLSADQVNELRHRAQNQQMN